MSFRKERPFGDMPSVVSTHHYTHQFCWKQLLNHCHMWLRKHEKCCVICFPARRIKKTGKHIIHTWNDFYGFTEVSTLQEPLPPKPMDKAWKISSYLCWTQVQWCIIKQHELGISQDITISKYVEKICSFIEQFWTNNTRYELISTPTDQQKNL